MRAARAAGIRWQPKSFDDGHLSGRAYPAGDTITLPGGLPVRYSLWMYGRMVGETTFELQRFGAKLIGTFHPTDYGRTVIDRVTAMTPALFAFGELCRKAG